MGITLRFFRFFILVYLFSCFSPILGQNTDIDLNRVNSNAITQIIPSTKVISQSEIAHQKQLALNARMEYIAKQGLENVANFSKEEILYINTHPEIFPIGVGKIIVNEKKELEITQRPVYIYTGNAKKDIEDFDRRKKEWISLHKEQYIEMEPESIRQDNVTSQIEVIKKKIDFIDADLGAYVKNMPSYNDSGNAIKDAMDYDLAKRKWIMENIELYKHFNPDFDLETLSNQNEYNTKLQKNNEDTFKEPVEENFQFINQDMYLPIQQPSDFPRYENTGNPMQDEKDFGEAKNLWIKLHSEEYKRMINPKQ